MTSDKVILDMVKGYCHITFTHNQFPLQLRPPQSIKFTDWESSLMDQEQQQQQQHPYFLH